MKDKTELIKATGAIHLQNKMTLLQRRVWNLLLRNAYEDLLDKDEHEVGLAELEDALEYSSRNRQHLKDSLEAMVGNSVKWNILHRDYGMEWGVAALLAEARIKGRVCTYQYSSTLRKLLYNPKLYARINLKIQNQFKNAHALALWELCVDCLDESTNYGESPWLNVEEFRELMGISKREYRQFKDLSKYVIKTPVEEINRLTDFNISIEYQRLGRKVVAIKFRVRRVEKLPAPNPGQRRLFPDTDTPTIVQELVGVGLSEEDAAEIWEKQWEYITTTRPPANSEDFSFYVREKIDLLKRQQASGKVESPTGFLLTAIKRNYTNRAFAEAEKQKKAEQATAYAAKRKHQLLALQGEKDRLEREHASTVHALCQEIIEEMANGVSHIMTAVLAEEPHYKQLYESHLSPLENYQSHHFLALEVDDKLMQHYPERFQTVNDDYAARRTTLDKKIAALS